MSSWHIICVVDGVKRMYIEVAGTAEEAIKQVLLKAPTGEIQQVTVRNLED